MFTLFGENLALWSSDLASGIVRTSRHLPSYVSTDQIISGLGITCNGTPLSCSITDTRQPISIANILNINFGTMKGTDLVNNVTAVITTIISNTDDRDLPMVMSSMYCALTSSGARTYISPTSELAKLINLAQFQLPSTFTCTSPFIVPSTLLSTYNVRDACTAGDYLNAVSSGISGCVSCIVTTPGYYCPQGGELANGVPCPAGTYSTEVGVVTGCTPCTPGAFCPEGAQQPTTCTSATIGIGNYCPAGSKLQGVPCFTGTNTTTLCGIKGGFFDASTANTNTICIPTSSLTDCSISTCISPKTTTDHKTCVLLLSSLLPPCSIDKAGSGYYCPPGAATPRMCPAGQYSTATSGSPKTCTPCDFHRNIAFGYYCPAGCDDPDGLICPPNTMSTTIVGTTCMICCTTNPPSRCGHSNFTCGYDFTGNYCACTMPPQIPVCSVVQPGYYCITNSINIEPIACPIGYYSNKNTGTPTSCTQCVASACGVTKIRCPSSFPYCLGVDLDGEVIASGAVDCSCFITANG